MALLEVRDLKVVVPAQGRAAVHRGGRGELRRGTRPDGRPGRRVRLRQVGDLAGDHGLLPKRGNKVTGSVKLRGHGPAQAGAKATMRDRRGRDLGMVFQDPLSSLNPVIPIGIQVTEVLERHRGMSRKAAMEEAGDLLDRGRHPGPDAAADGVPAPALRRHAAARADRDGAGLPSAAADRRRADHRAGRDHPGADPGAAAGTGARHRHRADHDHARPRRGRRAVRRGQRALRRPDRGAGRAACAVRHARGTRTRTDCSPRSRGWTPARGEQLVPIRGSVARQHPVGRTAAPSRRAAPNAVDACREVRRR